MLDEVNRTQGLSPRDFAITLQRLTDEELANQTSAQLWCWHHLQCQEIDYRARYHACVLEQFVRSKQRDHATI